MCYHQNINKQLMTSFSFYSSLVSEALQIKKKSKDFKTLPRPLGPRSTVSLFPMIATPQIAIVLTVFKNVANKIFLYTRLCHSHVHKPEVCVSKSSKSILTMFVPATTYLVILILKKISPSQRQGRKEIKKISP